MLGGIPLISVIGTPRAIGEGLGHRLKSRLQVLAQYLAEQLAANSRLGGRQLTPANVRERLRSTMPALADLDPGLAMELESLARAADLSTEDLFIIHGYADLLSTFACPSLQPSTYIAFTSEQTESHAPTMALVWESDPALLPYVTLVHRIPAHGPASLSLTLAGLHPIAFINEAGLAAASNTLLVSDGVPGQFTTHVLAALTSAPSYDDAVSRAQAGPRWGGRAIHLLAADGERCTFEVSGQHLARLPDPIRSAPRVHTNHPLDETIQSQAVTDPVSRLRLEQIAGCAIRTRNVNPSHVLDWFGLSTPPVQGNDNSARRRRGTAANPDACIVIWLSPATRELQVRRGPGSGLDGFRLGGTQSARSPKPALPAQASGP